MILVLPVVFETEKLQMEQQQQLQQRQVSPGPGLFASDGATTWLCLQRLGRPAVRVWVEVGICSMFLIVLLALFCRPCLPPITWMKNEIPGPAQCLTSFLFCSRYF